MSHYLGSSHQLKNAISREMFEIIEETFDMLATNDSNKTISKAQFKLAEKVP